MEIFSFILYKFYNKWEGIGSDKRGPSSEKSLSLTSLLIEFAILILLILFVMIVDVFLLEVGVFKLLDEFVVLERESTGVDSPEFNIDSSWNSKFLVKMLFAPERSLRLLDLVPSAARSLKCDEAGDEKFN